MNQLTLAALLLLSVICCKTYSQTTNRCSVRGRIIDGMNNEGIPYVSIVSLTDKTVGSVSDEQGYFELLLNSTCADSIYISRLGFRDTVIFFSGPKGFYELILKERITELEEVVINSSRLKSRVLGLDFAQMLERKQTFKAQVIQSDQPGSSLGNFYKVKNYKGYVDSIVIYIHPDFISSRFLLNVYCFNGNLNNYKLSPIQSWESLLKEPVIFQTKDRITAVRLQNCFFSDCDYLVFSFMPLRIKEMPEGYRYGMISYNSRSRSDKRFYVFGNKFVVLPASDGLIAMYAVIFVEE